MRKLHFIAGCWLIILLAGCAQSSSGSKPTWRAALGHALVEILSGGTPTERRHDSAVDGLWREGYGFNNPNLERRRQGQPPLNLDGSVHK